MRHLLRITVFLALACLVLLAGSGGRHHSAMDEIAAPYRWGLVEWELGNFLDKWWARAAETLPWNDPALTGEAALEEFFRLASEIDGLERPAGPDAPRLDDLRRRLAELRPQAEEKLEAEISAVLAQEGFQSRLGLIWPPVDTALTTPPSALITSPRHVIERRRDYILEPGLEAEAREALEDRIRERLDLSALVVNIGGIATYPSIVARRAGIERAMEIAAHEWLHQYWFFHPLGRNYFRDADTTILNESAANLAGREVSRRALAAVTGQPTPPGEGPATAEPPQGFDFRSAMRETRLETDRLLAEGRIREAEAYMEERRRLFMDEGYYIRKLNQAYFAFHGTYADSPASVSPIDGELAWFRERQPSLGAFIEELARFGSYEEFREHLTALRREGRAGPAPFSPSVDGQ